MTNILVVGSLAYDDVQTPVEHRTNVLGGAASYFAIAAGLYAPVRLVGVIGDDFREADVQRLRGRGIDLAGRWHAITITGRERVQDPVEVGELARREFHSGIVPYQ